MKTEDPETAHAVARAPLLQPGASRGAVARTVRWLVALTLVFGGIGLWISYRQRQVAAPIRYESVAVDRGPIAARVTATGTLSALVTVNVGSQVSGRIETLAADFGSKVSKGQVIATIEPQLFKSAQAQARANLSAAKAQVARALAQRAQAHRAQARARQLLAESLVSVQDFEAAQTELDVAQTTLQAAQASVEQANAALRQAQLNLEYCTIRSPIDGVVISRNVDVGQTVAAAFQAPILFSIAQDLTEMQVDTAVAEADIAKIRAGMPVTFTVDAHPGRDFSGVVRQVRDNAQTLQNVVTYDAVIDVDNRAHLLKPGMTATVTFPYARREWTLRVPNIAVRFRPSASTIERMLASAASEPRSVPGELKAEERTIWVLRGEHALPVKVRIGITDADYTEIVSGQVRAGDRVVTEVPLNTNEARVGA